MFHKHQTIYVTSLTVIILILVLFGLIMLSSASSVIGYTQKNQDTYYFFKHQLLFGFLPGLILFFICSRINYKFWQKNAFWFLLATTLLLILVLIPGMSDPDNPAKSWLNISGLSFQPSEFIKLTLIIYLAAWFNKSKEHIKSFSHGLLPFLLFTVVIAGLIAIQPDIGTMSVIIFIALGVYFLAGAKVSHLVSLLLVGAGLFALLILAAPYRLERVATFLNPQKDVQNVGYHLSQAKLAIGSGGFLGLGFGHSRQKFEFLPEVAGDSIFAIMAEELGFILSVLFITLLIYLVIKILKISQESGNDFAKLFSGGLAIWIGGQSLINIGAMLGVMPLTGIPLPFISFGGTALMALMVGCGILVNITKTLKH